MPKHSKKNRTLRNKSKHNKMREMKNRKGNGGKGRSMKGKYNTKNNKQLMNSCKKMMKMKRTMGRMKYIL